MTCVESIYMLSACPKILQSGWYIFRHDLVLNAIASIAIDAEVPALDRICEEPRRQKHQQANNRKWEVSVDKPLPKGIVVSALRPDLVLIDETQKRLILEELTVPWEESTAESHE